MNVYWGCKSSTPSHTRQDPQQALFLQSAGSQWMSSKTALLSVTRVGWISSRACWVGSWPTQKGRPRDQSGHWSVKCTSLRSSYYKHDMNNEHFLHSSFLRFSGQIHQQKPKSALLLSPGSWLVPPSSSTSMNCPSVSLVWHSHPKDHPEQPTWRKIVPLPPSYFSLCLQQWLCYHL